MGDRRREVQLWRESLSVQDLESVGGASGRAGRGDVSFVGWMGKEAVYKGRAYRVFGGLCRGRRSSLDRGEMEVWVC